MRADVEVRGEPVDDGTARASRAIGYVEATQKRSVIDGIERRPI